MREILFRGFHPCDGPDTIVVDGEKVKGRWVYGYYYKGIDGDVILSQPRDYGYADADKVIPSTVGQYIGLTDKNGKRIWEGDRLEPPDDEFDKCVVEYSDGSYRMTSYGTRGAMMEYGWDECAGGYGVIEAEPFDSYISKELEVIGTVFDDHEKN